MRVVLLFVLNPNFEKGSVYGKNSWKFIILEGI